MKILLIADPHHGHNNNDVYFIKKQIEYLKVVSDIIIDKNIEAIFVLGDFFDKKTLLDKKTIDIFWQAWDVLIKKVNHCFIISGNHDNYYKTYNKHHILDIMFPNNKIVDDDIFVFDNCVIVPWIHHNNKLEMLKKISEYNKEGMYLFGHFDKSGANMNATFVSTHDSMPERVYDNFERIFSGHYHMHQELNKWTFVGSPWHIHKGDELTKHGIMIFDNETGETEFIENKNNIYVRQTIKEDQCNKKTIKNMFKDIKDKILYLHINTTNIKIFEKVSDIIADLGPYKMEITYNEPTNSLIPDAGSDIKKQTEIEMVSSFLNEQSYTNEKESALVKKIFMHYYKK